MVWQPAPCQVDREESAVVPLKAYLSSPLEEGMCPLKQKKRTFLYQKYPGIYHQCSLMYFQHQTLCRFPHMPPARQILTSNLKVNQLVSGAKRLAKARVTLVFVPGHWS